MRPKAIKALKRKVSEKPVSPAKGGTATSLQSDVRELILSARRQVAQTVNAGLTLLYWQIGNRIRRDILHERRAAYGAEIVQSLAAKLEVEFGRGFGRRNLFRMIRFAEAFPDSKIVTSLMTQLGWTHFLHIIRLDDPLQRDFYAEMCRIENWDTRTLDGSPAEGRT